MHHTLHHILHHTVVHFLCTTLLHVKNFIEKHSIYNLAILNKCTTLCTTFCTTLWCIFYAPHFYMLYFISMFISLLYIYRSLKGPNFCLINIMLNIVCIPFYSPSTLDMQLSHLDLSD